MPFMHIRKLRFEGLLWLLEAGEGRPWSVEQGNAYSQLLAELRPAPDMRQRRICSLNGEKQMHHCWQNNELLQILWVGSMEQRGEKPEAEETCWLAADKAHLLEALALSWPSFEDSECEDMWSDRFKTLAVYWSLVCVTVCDQTQNLSETDLRPFFQDLLWDFFITSFMMFFEKIEKSWDREFCGRVYINVSVSKSNMVCVCVGLWVYVWCGGPCH